nr:hypothetical protein [uncultured Tyzzerella sp.]
MTEEQKLKYIGLKRKYLDLNKKKYFKDINERFKNICFHLNNDFYIFYMEDEEEILKIYNKCYDIFSFTCNASKLDKSNLSYFNMYKVIFIEDLYNNKKIFENCKYKYYYIICGRDFPIIKCQILYFFQSKEFISEIHYVNTEGSILLSENFKQIIYIMVLIL